ncbi:uncharacterized protein LOC131953417 [Physella acuta]|uniref:uncharacterized protein LOC131953417 n=1 Tax=Physella acuta TaxID=109671 RepID=UPI0027DC8A9C|nr:uncharacterized protein LOC131953417 [Physella acuta]
MKYLFLLALASVCLAEDQEMVDVLVDPDDDTVTYALGVIGDLKGGLTCDFINFDTAQGRMEDGISFTLHYVMNVNCAGQVSRCDVTVQMPWDPSDTRFTVTQGPSCV